jgi:hypothetical protein
VIDAELSAESQAWSTGRMRKIISRKPSPIPYQSVNYSCGGKPTLRDTIGQVDGQKPQSVTVKDRQSVVTSPVDTIHPSDYGMS